MTDGEPTCGKGLASQAPLPAKLGDLTSALADMLDAHTRALDLQDERGRDEQAAYLGVSKDGPYKPEHYRY